MYDVPGFNKDRCFASAYAYLEGYNFDEIREANKHDKSFIEFKSKLSTLLSLDEQYKLEDAKNFNFSASDTVGLEYLKKMLEVR